MMETVKKYNLNTYTHYSNMNYDNVQIRKVKILNGRAKEEAYRIGALDEDLVILRSTYYSHPTYNVEKIIGDPVSYLMKSKI